MVMTSTERSRLCRERQRLLRPPSSPCSAGTVRTQGNYPCLRAALPGEDFCRLHLRLGREWGLLAS